ncbi:hypothetical protein P4234_28600 [Pseudomonas aeruginosa]|nr:hypothetical protein [Pseudomonas aeruginosa]
MPTASAATAWASASTRAPGCFYRISGLGILGINFLFPLLYGGSAGAPAAALLGRQRRLLGMRGTLRHQFPLPGAAGGQPHGQEGSPPPRRLPLQRLLCVAGSARLDADLQAAFQRDYAALANIYGLSECGFAFLFGKRRGDAFDNSVGPAVGLELKLTDPDGRPLEGSSARAPVGAHAEPVLRLRQPPRPDRPGARGRLAEHPGPRLLRRGPLRARPRPLRRHHQQGRQPVPSE